MTEPQAGMLYRHFKGNMYQVITIAFHTETQEKMVVYQALYGDFTVYCRPYSMFTSEVDHTKYPEIIQRYRFEEVNRSELITKQEEADNGICSVKKSLSRFGYEEADKEGISKVLLDFLDAETSAQKLKVLETLEEEPDDKLINSIEAALDLGGMKGSTSERMDRISYHLRTKSRFETSRLR